MKLINTHNRARTHTHTHHARAHTHKHARARTHTRARSKKFVLSKIRHTDQSRRLKTVLKEMGFQSLSTWCLRRVRMAETVWKTVPGWGTDMWEWPLTKCFGTRMRNFENACICGGTEISTGSVQMKKFREVLWSSACEYIESKHANFVLYSCPDWKPV